MRLPDRVRALVADAIKAGELGDNVRDLWDQGVLELTRDGDIDWSDPRSPSVDKSFLSVPGDEGFWDGLAEGGPEWVNLAVYPRADRRPVVIFTTGGRPARSETNREPLLSLSGAPIGVVLQVGGQGVNARNGEYCTLRPS